MTKRNKIGQFLKGSHWRKRQPWWSREWLLYQYSKLKRSASDIATEGGVGETAILYWLEKHQIPRRSMSEARKVKRWGQSGSDNPMWGKRGKNNHRWRGGVTPERQAFYISQEWKAACSMVWARDDAVCQRCGRDKRVQPNVPFHVHHIASFANRELRADINNLVLLCEACHHFVHSRKNAKREYLSKK